VAARELERDPAADGDAEDVHVPDPDPVEVGLQGVGDGRDGGAAPQRG
jgi:hypothetical protein